MLAEKPNLPDRLPPRQSPATTSSAISVSERHLPSRKRKASTTPRVRPPKCQPARNRATPSAQSPEGAPVPETMAQSPKYTAAQSPPRHSPAPPESDCEASTQTAATPLPAALPLPGKQTLPTFRRPRPPQAAP